MNKLVPAVAASLLFVPSAFAQFGGLPTKPSLPSTSTSSSGGATPADIDAFQASAAAADKLVGRASTSLLKAVGSKQQVDKYEADVKAANGIADPKEKQAKLDKAEADKNATLAAVDYAKAKESLAKEADQKKKDAVGASLWNLALGALQDADLVLVGKKIASGTPSPAVATRIPGVTDTVSRLASQGDALTKIVGGAKVLMSVSGLEKLPAKASEEAKVINDI